MEYDFTAVGIDSKGVTSIVITSTYQHNKKQNEKQQHESKKEHKRTSRHAPPAVLIHVTARRRLGNKMLIALNPPFQQNFSCRRSFRAVDVVPGRGLSRSKCPVLFLEEEQKRNIIYCCFVS